MGFLFKVALHMLAIAATFWAIGEYLFPDKFAVQGEPLWLAYAIVAAVFGVINTFVKPFIKLAMLPVQLITLGLSGFLLNAILLFALAEVLTILQIQGTALAVEGIVVYIISGLILGISNMIIHKLV